MIQIDGFKRNVYIKFTEEEDMNNVLQATGGHMDFKHDNGEITQKIIEIAEMGLKMLGLPSCRQRRRNTTLEIAYQSMEKLGVLGMKCWHRCIDKKYTMALRLQK